MQVQNNNTDIFGNQLEAQQFESTEPTTTPSIQDDGTLTFSKPTRVRRDGNNQWEATTNIDCNGYTWHLCTSKGSKGVSTWVTTVEVNGNFTNFGSLMGKPKDQDFRIQFSKQVSRVTEDVVIEAHTEAIAEFHKKKVNGELATAPKGIEVGQILFTHGNGNKNERAVYEIQNTSFGITYKCVLLDGSGTRRDDHVRPYTEKFGIGVYYNEGETITQEEVNHLLPICLLADENRAIEQDKQRKEEAEKSRQRTEYLAQFKQADTRQRTNLIKEYILENYPTVSTVYVKSDSFSGGDSLDVTYHAPERIEELDQWIRSFAYGKFDSMNDIYENSEEQTDIIVNGYILSKSKYASAHYEFAELQERKPQVKAVQLISNNGIHVTLVSDKGGIEIKFNEKPNEDVLTKLKSLGFRWSRFNKCWWANQSTSRADYARSLMGYTSTSELVDTNLSGYIDAQEDAFLSNQQYK